MQDSIASFLPSLLKASWQGGVLILLVLAAQWVFGRRLSPRWRYGFWLLVMIKLALPWTVPAPMSLFNILSFPGHSASLQDGTAIPVNHTSTESQSIAAVQEKQPAASARRSASASNLVWLLGLWAVGASALTICLLVTHRRIAKRVAACRPMIDTAVLNLLEDCKQQMGVRVPITLVETTEVGVQRCSASSGHDCCCPPD